MSPSDALWFRALAGLLVGLALGSFATMLAYRLPRRLSIVTPRSHCPTCKSTLGPCDLVPVFSYLSSGGKCRHCGAKIGPLYLLIELTVTAFCVIAALII